MSSWLTSADGAERMQQPALARSMGSAKTSVAGGALVGARTTAMPGLARRSGSVVRRITDRELKERGAQVAEMAKSAPTAGMNLWVARNAELEATIHLVGTYHGLKLTQVGAWRAIVSYLRDGTFTHVYTETTGPSVDALPATKQLIGLLEKRVEHEGILANAPDPEGRPAKTAKSRIADIDSRTGKVGDLGLDDAYAGVAMASSTPAPVRGTLETDQSRAQAHAKNAEDRTPIAKPEVTGMTREAAAKVRGEQEIRDKGDVAAGDQRAIFAAQAEEMAAGLDVASGEERNQQWVAGTKVAKRDSQVWIVGAAHLPGLIVLLKKAGWTAEHRAPS